MKLRGLCIVFFLCMFADFASAKAQISRITLEGDSLRAPIEIHDTQALSRFNPWRGRGAWSEGVEQTRGFIIDWASEASSPAKDAAKPFKVKFYASHSPADPEKLAYSVTYFYVASDGAREAVYLPGKGDSEYSTNAASIFRGVEGRWFRPTSEWQSAIRPLIRQALSQ